MRVGAVIHAGGLLDPLQGLHLMEQLCAVAAGADARAREGGGKTERDDGDGIGHDALFGFNESVIDCVDSTIAGGSHGRCTR